MPQTQQQSEWTTKRLLEWTTDYLRQSKIDQPRLCAELMLAHILDRSRIELYTQFDYQPNPDQLKQFRDLVKRAAQHEPSQYLTGKAHFYSLELAVTPNVLIPRPETETLVSQAIDVVRKLIHRPTVSVLDLCTGSGCIAVAIAHNAVEAEIVAIDQSSAALDVARHNIEKYDLQNRITLLQSDLFESLGQSPIQLFDLIVSNPPYIADSEFDNLPDNIRLHEPACALKAGADGLDFYRRILEHAQPYLADDAAILFEIGHDQAQQVTALCENTDYLKDIKTIKDNLNLHRVVIAHKK